MKKYKFVKIINMDTNKNSINWDENECPGLANTISCKDSNKCHTSNQGNCEEHNHCVEENKAKCKKNNYCIQEHNGVCEKHFVCTSKNNGISCTSEVQQSKRVNSQTCLEINFCNKLNVDNNSKKYYKVNNRLW